LRVFEIGGEEIELRLPELPVVRDPLEGAAHRHGIERGATHAPFLLHGREPRALEHADVFRDGGERHREARGELADGAVAGGESREDVAAGGVGEGGEGGVEGAGRVNHMV
jgi:hypothetical protein